MVEIDSTAGALAARADSPPSHYPISPAAADASANPDRRTRDRVGRLILESGPLTAAGLGERLGLSPAAVRRHLDLLVADGVLAEVQPRPAAHRGRGRPARRYALTDHGRFQFPHAYDDLASMALRYLLESGGAPAVAAFADQRAHLLAGALNGPATPVQLADSLTAAGYATTVEVSASGTQMCQHHCPVAHVAAQFPELCQAETRAFAKVLGTHVQRLATIAHGDGVCTTHIPSRHLPPGGQAANPSTTGSAAGEDAAGGMSGARPGFPSRPVFTDSGSIDPGSSDSVSTAPAPTAPHSSRHRSITEGVPA